MDEDLKQAIERLHHCSASFLEDVLVVEKFGGKTVWSGKVSVFLIKGHPQADKCYAWSSLIEGSTKRRYYAVLHIPPIDLPEKAVRASIVHDLKKNTRREHE
ncbi:MAG: hypothetical protein Q8M54_03270 [Desulfobaccales bacterium]|nr:hypothetical protein [Desulfobaccales bacterium]